MQERQRTVIVVAVGLGLAVLALTVNRLAEDHGGGWFAYAPNTSPTFPSRESTGSIWREAAVWWVAIATWAALSLWLYRRRPSD